MLHMTHFLTLLLVLREGIILMRFDDGTICGHYGFDSILGKYKQFMGLAVVQVVEEDAA